MDDFQVYGPHIITEECVDQKLYCYCKKNYPHFSRSFLRSCFMHGFVYINDEKASLNHVIESYKMKLNDNIKLVISRRLLVEDSLVFKDLQIGYQNDFIATFSKPIGVDMSDITSVFSLSCKLRAWDSKYYQTAAFVYSLERLTSGIVLLCPSNVIAESLAQQILANQGGNGIKLGMTAVFCGCKKLSMEASPGFTLQHLDTIHNTTITITGEIVKESHCRSKDMLHLCDLHVGFHNNSVESSSVSVSAASCVTVLTNVLNKVKKLLVKKGYPIVGSDNLLVRATSAFFSFDKISIKNLNLCSSESEKTVPVVDVKLLVPYPNKFDSLLEREESLYQKAVVKQQEQQQLQNDLARVTDSSNTTTPLLQSQRLVQFCQLPFIIDNRYVMSPRSSSERMVASAVEYLHTLSTQSLGRNLNVADFGAGSGCLLFATLKGFLSKEGICYNSCRGVGIDISSDALAIAEINRHNLDLSTCTALLQGDFLKIKTWQNVCTHPLFADCCDYEESTNIDCVEGKEMATTHAVIDVILCNPPYSARKEKNRLSNDIIRQEPSVAFFAHKTDPLYAYHKIVQVLKQLEQQDSVVENESVKMFADHTRLFIEIGSGQEMAVKLIFSGLKSWFYVETLLDYKSIPRVLIFQFGKFL